MLFRHMFYCKHVERLLCNVWISNKDFRQYSLHSAKWWDDVKFNVNSCETKHHPIPQFKPPPLRFAVAFALRQRMLNFVQNIQYYMMFEVMEPTWHIMENNLKTVRKSSFLSCLPSVIILTSVSLFLLQASNIDDVLCHHTSFLDNCLKDCMLTNPELLRIFSKLMSVCVMFTNCMQVCWHVLNSKLYLFKIQEWISRVILNEWNFITSLGP